MSVILCVVYQYRIYQNVVGTNMSTSCTREDRIIVTSAKDIVYLFVLSVRRITQKFVDEFLVQFLRVVGSETKTVRFG